MVQMTKLKKGKGFIFMSILKKATIALTVAGCLFLGTPMSAQAAEADACRHVHATLVQETRFQGTEIIDFSYKIDVDGDGVKEVVSDSCRHAVFDVYSRYRCDDCGAYATDWVYKDTYYTSHTDANCPEK